LITSRPVELVSRLGLSGLSCRRDPTASQQEGNRDQEQQEPAAGQR